MSDLLHELAVMSDVYDIVSGNTDSYEERQRRWTSPVMFYLIGTAVVAGLIFFSLTLLSHKGRAATAAAEQAQREAPASRKNPWAKD